ncbi:MAG: twin-arginine translocase TatA/TatE family subunit [Polyangia bacterium]
MLGLGPMELFLILIIVLVIFGAGKLPQIGDALGKSIRNFKRSSDGANELDVSPKSGQQIKEIESDGQAQTRSQRDKA